MTTNQNIVRVVGGLYILQMTTAVLSYSVILEPKLNQANFLGELASSPGMVIMAMLFDMITGATVFAIAVLLFPILKKYSERVALWYVGLRLAEFIALMISGILLLTLLSLGQRMMQLSSEEFTYLETFGRYIRNARGDVQDISLLVYSLGAWSFYGLLFYSRLIPRFISIWGLIAVTLLFIEILSNVYDTSIGGMMIMMPLGVNEVFLGFWLIFKGFKQH